ncbi:MAG: hypothetical protein KAJ58_00490 [Candidatus Pacebacteria bacterium]|nr:hypothetical protein [Candidatus Paceibacterota bacterium]
MSNLQLENENFKVDSSGWEQFTDNNGVVYLQNPEKDIWEYVGGTGVYNTAGQQLFTFSAAIRETKKAGKQIPTVEEWSILGEKGRESIPNLFFAGVRFSYGYVNLLNFYYTAFFWSSSSINEDLAWANRRDITDLNCKGTQGKSGKQLGLSIRCLK